MRLLFVVHRYYPYPGGSEYYVRDMAEEAVKRGHFVGVLAHTHQGDQNGVRVTNDYNVLAAEWDLIVVHGGDCISQDVVHMNTDKINSPVAYMLIKPSTSEACMKGLREHRILAYSTDADLEHIWKNQLFDKARRVRHGINLQETIKTKNPGPLTTVSVGGFSPHKAMIPLARVWEENDGPGELHLYGYMDGPTPPESNKVKVFKNKSKDEVLQAIANAGALVMNSYEEGFGLVLLEAMANHTPWFARDIAGANQLKRYGNIYTDESHLISQLQMHYVQSSIPKYLTEAFEYVSMNHSIVNTVNDLEDIVTEMAVRR